MSHTADGGHTPHDDDQLNGSINTITLDDDISADTEAVVAARNARMRVIRDSTIAKYTPYFPGKPELRLLLYNIQKKANVGQLLRSAVAFGVKQVIVVKKRSEKLKTFGNMGTAKHIVFVEFDVLSDAIAYIEQQQFNLIGVEIDPCSVDVTEVFRDIQHDREQSSVFYNKTVLVLGNEGSGLNTHVQQHCKRLTYIPQYTTGTASLNVLVAGSIVMHHFAVWAGYKSATRVGVKYIDTDTSVT